MSDIILLDDDNRFISLDEGGVLSAWRNSHIVDLIRLTPNEAVNLASALLRYATQNGASRE